ALGLSFESVALVHFRASKNIDSKTVRCLLQVADILKRKYGIERAAEKYAPKKHDSPLADSPPMGLSKSEMEAMAQAFRNELGLNDRKPLDPLKIAIEGVKVLTIRKIQDIPQKVLAYLEGPGSTTWSAMSVPVDEDNDKWAIVRNEQHLIVRQHVSLLE